MTDGAFFFLVLGGTLLIEVLFFGIAGYMRWLRRRRAPGSGLARPLVGPPASAGRRQSRSGGDPQAVLLDPPPGREDYSADIDERRIG